MNKKELKKFLMQRIPYIMNEYMFIKKMRYFCNLNSPKSFNEKIQWLKFNYYKDNVFITKCADKYKVREYIIEKGLGNILVPLLGCWDDTKSIDFQKLPEKYVLKCNHGCGYNIICSNRSEMVERDIVLQLNKWLNEDFSLNVLEPQYKNIERKIIAEKYLGNEILDYKFFCFSGKPEYMYISRVTPNSNGRFKCHFWKCDGRPAEFTRTDELFFEEDEKPELPKAFDEMKNIASVLSKDFPFVRVDLFYVEGKIYFSELTFTPAAGMMPLEPKEWDRKLGDLIDLSKTR